MTSMQGSYIGNTTASQAVKAGSIPVPCSRKEPTFVYDKCGFFSTKYIPCGICEITLRVMK